MKTLLKVVCENAHLQENDTLNIIGVFDQITTHELPASHPKLAFVLILEDDQNEENHTYKYYFDVIDPNGKKIFDGKANSNPFTIEMKKGGKARIIANLQLLKFEEEGPHTATFHFDDDIFTESIIFQVIRLQKSPLT